MLVALPAVLKVMGWACLSAAVSMALYAKLSPQRTLQDISAAQKLSRQTIRAYEGDVAGMYALLGKDLLLSLRHLGMILLPVMISILPVLGIMMWLFNGYTGALVSFGPEWFRSVEFFYLSTLLVASLIIKIKFRIL